MFKLIYISKAIDAECPVAFWGTNRGFYFARDRCCDVEENGGVKINSKICSGLLTHSRPRNDHLFY